jgi:Holliday junction resolvase-like predicted endonuclease
MLPPASAVGVHKEKNIMNSAAIYLNRYKTKKQPRFDIVEVIVKDREVISINHIEKAF